MQNEIEDYTIRAYYPNYRMLSHYAKNPEQSISKGLPAFLKPELEYRLKNATTNTLDLEFPDLIFLSENKSNEEAREYINCLVKSTIDKEPETCNQFEKQRQFVLEKTISRVNGAQFIENEFVVPSCSSKQYNIHQVSHKGASLMELTQEGYPVPDFCILTSKVYKLEKKERDMHVQDAIRNLEILTGEKLGSIHSPLVFAMRCATSKYIPGLMPTYLNVGVTQDTFLSLKDIYGYHVSSKIYLNNLQTIYHILYPDSQAPIFKDKFSTYSFRDTYSKIQFYYEEIEKKNPRVLRDAYYQIEFFIDEVHRFYEKNSDLLRSLFIRDKSFPSFILQKMVWTVRDRESYPGVLYSAHSRTGIGMQIESYPEIFGEDIMTGAIEAMDTSFVDPDDIKTRFPAVYHFIPKLNQLERKTKSPVTVEFAAESFQNIHYFAMLQLNASEMTGRATLLAAMRLYRQGHIDRQRVINLIHPYHTRQIFSESIRDESFKKMTLFSSGVSVLPRLAVSARVFFSKEKAIQAKKKGDNVCLCKDQFFPADTMIMSEVDAILSLNPAAIHVVTACLSYGVPAFLNLENYHVRLEGNKLINQSNMEIQEGDWITISSKYQKIFLGKAEFTPARFRRYLNGEKLVLNQNEAEMYRQMAAAFYEYEAIVESLDTSDITNLNDLIKVIRTDLKSEPVKASKFMNTWFDANTQYYLSQVFKSTLGMHKDQHEVYNLLSTERKIHFFKQAIEFCKTEKVSGYLAGSFMLGRFLSIHHPVSFWKSFYSGEILLMLNEYIRFEKYLEVLNEVGERNLNRARNILLDKELPQTRIHPGSCKHLINLKLSNPDWTAIESLIEDHMDEQLPELIALLKKPYLTFYDPENNWSWNSLIKICETEKLPVPNPQDV